MDNLLQQVQQVQEAQQVQQVHQEAQQAQDLLLELQGFKTPERPKRSSNLRKRLLEVDRDRVEAYNRRKNLQQLVA